MTNKPLPQGTYESSLLTTTGINKKIADATEGKLKPAELDIAAQAISILGYTLKNTIQVFEDGSPISKDSGTLRIAWTAPGLPEESRGKVAEMMTTIERNVIANFLTQQTSTQEHPATEAPQPQAAQTPTL